MDYVLLQDIDVTKFRAAYQTYFYLGGHWENFGTDFWVKVLKRPYGEFSSHLSTFKKTISEFVSNSKLPELLDGLEFIASHPLTNQYLVVQMSQVFVESRLAYRMMEDGQIVAISSKEDANTFITALSATELKNSNSARVHLISAGIALRKGDWPGCIRESIHAVESVAVKASEKDNTLGAALSTLEKRGDLHGALKTAFNALYGYTSDAEGVRHALVFKDKATVDEADAMFMLGACSAFVTYLLARQY